jgi:hypothetical protein
VVVSVLDRLALQVGACALLVLGACLWHTAEVSGARKEGYAAAVAAGEKQRALDAEVALTNERALRARLAAADTAAQTREQTYAENLAAAQRRVRAGDDSLRIAIRTIRATATPADRPAAGGPEVDESRAELVPEVAADAVGFAATAAGLVRKIDRVTERFNECRALNNGPTPAGSGRE